jgi:5-methylcytosine-specific restriction endonuclease McrA
VPPHRYSEQQVRSAVADPQVRTMADLCRRLGIVPRGANYETVRAYATTLGLDVDMHLAWRRLDRDDDDLRAAVDGAASVDEVLRRLSLRQDGAIRRTVRQRLRDLGLEPAFADPPPALPAVRARHRSYSDTELRKALADPSIDGYPALCGALGLARSSTTYRRLREHAEALGLTVPDRWSRRGPRPSPSGRAKPLYPEEPFRRAIAASTTMADAIRRLGDRPTPGAYQKANRSLAAYAVDRDHHRPNAGRRRPRPDDDLFVRGALRSGHSLRVRLQELGMPPRCTRCQRSTWEGGPIPLEVDHIDGDRRNNLRDNLRLLCPSCHALTPTYRGRNIPRRNGRRPTTATDDDAPR